MRKNFAAIRNCDSHVYGCQVHGSQQRLDPFQLTRNEPIRKQEPTMPPLLKIDCLVVGDGPAGLAAATALARSGTEVALAGLALSSPAQQVDTRTAALFPPVVQLLRNLGAWADLAAASAPLRGIRIVDGTGRLLRAPEVVFRAEDIERPDLGHNVPNAALIRALTVAARRAGVLFLDDGPVVGVDRAARRATARLTGGRAVEAHLIVGADGRASVCRQSAGIAVSCWTYEQAAIAVRFDHTRPHRGISTELHRPAGPCTTVPLPGNASSLVWVERPGDVERLMAATPEAFMSELSDRLDGLLGDISNLGTRRAFPLTGLKAENLARGRIALVGEAGHVLPPIGAQGLNLGMFDVAVLADGVERARNAGQDIGEPEMLEAYARARSADMHMRQGAVDFLNRTLTSGMLPLDLARGAGLHLLAAAPALRRRLMEQGLAPPAPLATLMRPDFPPPQPSAGPGPASRDPAAALTSRTSTKS